MPRLPKDPAEAFRARVLSLVCRIPPGRVCTYGDVARLAGRAGAARAVGSIMRACRSDACPCHRVIGAGGRLGGFGRSPDTKRLRLQAEGVLVSGTRVRNWPGVRWPGSPGPARRGERKTKRAGHA
jgi:methylated-DNA-protein-cysteine methyltransferase-like protein